MENFKTTATLNKNSNFYEHFGIREALASVYGNKPEEIVELEMKISEDQTIPMPNEKNLNADYWGWYNNSSQRFNMIYAKRFLLEMCFPYGISSSERVNQGKAYRLEIISIVKNSNN